MIEHWVDVLLRLGGGVGLPSILVYLVTQRRRASADTAVVEKTLPATVSRADTGALEAHVLAVERAFQAERDSKDRVITGLRDEIARKDVTIADLRTQVATLTRKVEELGRHQSGGAQ